MVKTSLKFPLTGLSSSDITRFLASTEDDLLLELLRQWKRTKSLTGVIAAVLRGVSETYVFRRSKLDASQILAVLSFDAVMK